MSTFNFEYETDLSLEECTRRLSDNYVEKKEREGTPLFRRSAYWSFGVRKIKGERYKLVTGDSSNGFVFIISLSETSEGKRHIACKHNPFRPTAWGMVGSVGAIIALLGLFCLPVPPLAGILWFLAAPFLIICGVKESIARRIVNEYFTNALEAKPYTPVDTKADSGRAANRDAGSSADD
jgi:hypothetical protein